NPPWYRVPRVAVQALIATAACSAPRNLARPAAEASPLSLAADDRMILIPAGTYVSGSTPEERATAYDDYQVSAGHDGARAHKWFDGEPDRHVAVIPAFRIDLMPVTQVQYAEFVTAGQAPAPAIDEATWARQGFTQDFVSQV